MSWWALWLSGAAIAASALVLPEAVGELAHHWCCWHHPASDPGKGADESSGLHGKSDRGGPASYGTSIEIK
eukprot:6872121-Prymnesium_polylepis.1